MTEVKRIEDPDIIYLLKPYFIEDGGYTKEVMANEFILLMKFSPEKICVLVGYDDKEIKGFLIGWDCPRRNYNYIVQAYSIAENSFAKEGMDRFVEWSKSIGKTEIRFETERNSVQMVCSKRYGFNEHGIVMSRLI